MPKLTPWFPPEIKPVYVGAYWVTHKAWDHAYDSFAYWNGTEWSDSYVRSTSCCPDKTEFIWGNGAYQDKSWRGLAEKPE